MKKRLISITAICISSLITGTASAQESISVASLSSGASSIGSGLDLYSPPGISADGTLVVFATLDAGVPADTNIYLDVYLRDRVAGTTTRISVSTTGGDPNGHCREPDISGDGRYIVYSSDATNIVTGDTNGVSDCFLFDRQTSTTTRVSIQTGGTGQTNGASFRPSVSNDGNRVAFSTIASNLGFSGISYVCVWDQANLTTTPVSVDSNGNAPNDDSDVPWISGNGNFVAYHSWASDIVAGNNDTNNAMDVFRVNVSTLATTRVSRSTGNVQGDSDSFVGNWLVMGNFISDDGTRIVFASNATNLVAGDGNGTTDLFLRDTAPTPDTTIRLGEPSGGGDPDLYALAGAISPDGRFVSLSTDASNTIATDTNLASDVFLIDTLLGVTHRVSEVYGGAEGNGNSFISAVSQDGRQTAFFSGTTNLVAGGSSGTDLLIIDECKVDMTPYGTGTAGSGGLTPVFAGIASLCEAGGSRVDLTNGLGGASGLLFVGTMPGSISTSGGILLVDVTSPYFTVPVTLGGSTGVAGAGFVSLLWPDLHGLEGTTTYLQILLTDAGGPAGVSFSNGLAQAIGP